MKLQFNISINDQTIPFSSTMDTVVNNCTLSLDDDRGHCCLAADEHVGTIFK